MKKILNSIKTWWERATKKTIDWAGLNAKAAFEIVNALKVLVESPVARAVTLLTKTPWDDNALIAARHFLPIVAEKLLVADIVLSSNPSNADILAALIEYLKKQNKDVRAAFYITLAGMINEALSDGKITLAEGISIGQVIYQEIKG